MHAGLPQLIPLASAAPPTPEQFWAVMVWGVVPAVLGIWIVYRQQQERLRRAHRRLRQLEARLTLSLVPVAGSPFRPTLKNSKPSSLTTRVLIPAVPGKGRGYTQPVPGPLS